MPWEIRAVWVREKLLPALPAQVRIVVAGRNAPDTLWTAHPLWSEAMRCIQLSSLSREESSHLLEMHAVDKAAHEAILEFSHGHPLALVLLAAEMWKHGRIPSSLGRDAVRELIKRCISGAPTPLHRRALEVSARARTTTVALLTDVVDPAPGVDLVQLVERAVLHERRDEGAFAARSRPRCGRRGFAVAGSGRLSGAGWRTQPLSSEATPQWPARLSCRHGTAIPRTQLCRHETVFRLRRAGKRFHWGSHRGPIGNGIARLRDAGLPPAEKEMFDLWSGHPATRTFVARRPDGSVCGVTMILEIDRVDDVTADKDPIVSAVRRSLGHTLLGSDGVSLMSRFTIPEGDRREASPAMNALQICHLVHWATEQDLHLWIIVAHHPDHFAPLLAEMHFERVPDCDRTFGGMPMGCFMHDWKSEPWLVWRDRSSRL